MNCKELIMSIIDSPDQNGYSMDVDDPRKLIAIAYYMGRESATQEISDKYNAILAAQIDRAKKCRYHNLAMEIQGNVRYIYSGDYGRVFTSMFGKDETTQTKKTLSMGDK